MAQGIVRRHKRGVAVLLFFVGILLLGAAPVPAGLSPVLAQAVVRAVLSVVVLLMVAALGGGGALRPTTRGLCSALREGVYPVAVAGGYCALEVAAIVTAASQGVALPEGWLASLLEVLALCVFVGVFEEGLFRLVLLGGLLSRHGATRNGLLASAIASSVVFGAMHVTEFAAGWLDPLTLLQMLLKTAQAGILGLLLCAVLVRTHSFWGVALLHCLMNFLLFVPVVLAGGEDSLDLSYVSEAAGGPEALMIAVALVIAYVVAVALFLPAALRGWRLLEEAALPEMGPLEPGWEPRETPRDPSGGRPVPPWVAPTDGRPVLPQAAPAVRDGSSRGFVPHL